MMAIPILWYSRGRAGVGVSPLAPRPPAAKVRTLMSTDHSSTVPSPLVALAGWVVPGAGYVLLGQIGRGVTIGITILLLFAAGLLIAGVRVIDVPGYDASGQPIMVSDGVNQHWALWAAPLTEIRNKPWALPQALSGPVSFLAAGWSVYESRPDPSTPDQPRGAASHGRVSEIGSLYLSVAGLLNLMAIIDSSHRASQSNP
jgi:hypothetical protein